MSIAKGAKSRVAWKEESALGTVATGNFNFRPVTNESLDTAIETITGEDIREDRATPNLRGGNISVGGNLTHDFGISNQALPWLRHLLAAGEAVANAALTPAAYAADTIYSVGDFALGSGDGVYVCVVAGTSDSGVTQASLTETVVGGQEAEAGGDEWRYLGPSGTAVYPHQLTPLPLAGGAGGTAYKRGDYVLGTNNGVYVCVYGGLVAEGTVATALSGTSVGGRETVTAESGSDLTFEYVGPFSSTTIYEHTLTAGSTFAAGGLSIEKQILGGTSPMYLMFIGGRLNSLDLNMSQRGITKASWDILGIKNTKSGTSGAGTPVSLAEVPVVGHDIYIHMDDTYTGSNANQIWREGTLRIQNGIDADAFVLGNRYRIDVPEGQRQVNGSLTAYFVDTTQYDYFINESTLAMGVSFIRDGDFLRFEMPEVKLTGNGAPKIAGAGLMTMQFDWTAFKNAAAHDVKIVARNTTRVLPI